MKKIKISLLLGLLFALLVACGNDDKLQVSDNPISPVLNTPTKKTTVYSSTQSAYVLVKDSASKTAETFTASAADFGVDAQVTYTIEVDKNGNNFANAQSVSSTTVASGVAPSIALTVSQLNNPIASESALACTSGVSTAIDVRIKAAIGTYAIYSNTVTINVVPYPTYGLLYVPGNYQSSYPDKSSWTPACTNTILYSSANNSKYEGYLDMSSNTSGDLTTNFKFTEYPDWSHTCYGAGSSSGTLSSSGGNISLAFGYYKLNVDISAATYTATAITQWGVYGTIAGVASSEVTMTFSTTTKLWTATVTFVSGDKFKIRANAASTIAYGYDSSTGKYTTSGSDITVSIAGTYAVTLDLRQYSGPGYSITLTKQ
jgi:starch-binding outer membrane protein SusE/F